MRGHIESISIMSFLQSRFLIEPDKFNRSPSYIFQRLKPLPHVRL